ncbi:MAG TPA: YdeI/OmpD-associated family protein [Chitinophagales bacterium]|nr:YdeI/OmpD-associated family protein [Chitinophagales bacterium]
MNPKVDWYFTKNKGWQREIESLRKIVLDTGLTEELKWGVPCYTLNGSNVVLIHCFKEYCALLFHKGALLKDKEKILVQQTKNVQSARQIRFTDVEQIHDMKGIVAEYIHQAVKVEKAGLKVPMKKTKEFEMPEEFRNKLDKDKALKKAFDALTPGRQRGYLLHFSSAKLSKTRESRIEKATPMILDGKGLDD